VVGGAILCENEKARESSFYPEERKDKENDDIS